MQNMNKRDDAIDRDQTNLRMELEAHIDTYLLNLPYEAKQDTAEAAIGTFALRERFEQVMNTTILALSLKEKIKVAEGFEYQIPVRYANAASEQKAKDSGRSPQ